MTTRGRAFEKGDSGNPRGRPVGSRDRVPRGLIRRVLEDLLTKHNGHDLMVKAAKNMLAKGGRDALE